MRKRERLRGGDRGHQAAGEHSTGLLDGAGLDAQRPDHVRGAPEKLARAVIANAAAINDRQAVLAGGGPKRAAQVGAGRCVKRGGRRGREHPQVLALRPPAIPRTRAARERDGERVERHRGLGSAERELIAAGAGGFAKQDGNAAGGRGVVGEQQRERAGAGTAVQAADDHDRPVRLGERQCRASSCG